MDDEEISLRNASNNHVLYNIKLTKKIWLCIIISFGVRNDDTVS